MDADEPIPNAMNRPSSQSQDSLRIGAVSYLNTKPLVYGLQQSLSASEVVYQLPSRLADSLANQELDIALVPSIELARHPDWTIISDACIACRGPVLSVKLLFRVPPAEVRSMVLDEGSRTSAMMAQVLLKELYGVEPSLSSLPITADPAEAEADAILMIGDRAIYARESKFHEVWDLGDRWCRWSELPFVFAMWVARPGVLAGEAANALSKARDSGCGHLNEIASEQASAMNLPLGLVEEYLRRNLYFYLGPDERRGLSLFYQKAASQGFIDFLPKVTLDDCTVES